MMTSDRRPGFRVGLDVFLNQYVRDQPFRCLATNLSESGIFLSRAHPTPEPRPRERREVGLEFELPGTGEVIWARGEVCYAHSDAFAESSGVRFTGLPSLYARMIRAFCWERRRQHLARLLARIRR